MTGLWVRRAISSLVNPCVHCVCLSAFVGLGIYKVLKHISCVLGMHGTGIMRPRALDAIKTYSALCRPQNIAVRVAVISKRSHSGTVPYEGHIISVIFP